MSDTGSMTSSRPKSGIPLANRAQSRIPVFALGFSLGSFLALTYVLCVLFDLWFPNSAMHPAWSPLLPGFVWISWAGFFLGLVEAFAYGWYVALVFAPLYNFFAGRLG